MRLIQTTITPSISFESIKNLCSNWSSECDLSKTFRPRLKIPYHSKFIVETVTEGHFSKHFLSDYGSWITSHKLFFTQYLISRLLISWYRKNISKPNSCANRYTSIFTPLHRHIIGIRILANSVGHVQTTITLSISIEKIQNLFSNSSTECVLSKTFRWPLKIPYHSKVIAEMMKECYISTHFLSDYGS